MKLGQHFLIDRDVTERIVHYSELKPDDRILEIGPGEGDLTQALAAHVERVYAVEVDPDLATNLCWQDSERKCDKCRRSDGRASRLQ